MGYMYCVLEFMVVSIYPYCVQNQSLIYWLNSVYLKESLVSDVHRISMVMGASRGGGVGDFKVEHKPFWKVILGLEEWS